MANTVLFILLICLINTASLKLAGRSKSIHLSPHLQEKELNGFTLSVNVKRSVNEENIASYIPKSFSGEAKQRRKRDAASSTNLKPESKVSYLNDSHTQMVIHWAGKNSDVIIALTKGVTVGHVGEVSSNIFHSHDYGKTFRSIKDKFVLPGNKTVLLSKYFNSPVLISHYFFVDETNQYIFPTRYYGDTVSAVHVPFVPRKIRFHRTNVSIALAMNDKDDLNKDLFMTLDFGMTWRKIQENVRAFYWGDDDNYGYNTSCIYILRETYNDLGNVIRTCNYFVTETELLSFAHDFEIKGAYMFATRKRRLLGGTGFAHQIYVSYYRNRFQDAQFPHILNNLDYYVADASEDQVFMCVSNNSRSANLYISNVNGTKFSLALTDVLYFNPDGSHSESWLKYYMDEPFADVHKVEGIRGVYIVTQLINSTLAFDHQRTLVTYDKGGTWQQLVAPQRDMYDKPTNCSRRDAYDPQATGCSLHLTQKFDRLYASSRASPILSKESAPGLIVATGSTGSRIHIDNSAGIYVSTDAGFSWHQVLLLNHFFAIADHGGVIVAVNSFEPTNQIVYSTDEGETWHKYNFTTVPIRIHGLLTEPGEATTIVFLFGSNVDMHSWQVIHLNLSTVFAYKCSDSDYKEWSLPDDTPFEGCLLGRKTVYEKRIPHTNCYNGRDYVRETNTNNCPCIRGDFECDFGFRPNEWFLSTACVIDHDVDQDVHRIPSPCPEGTFYPHTRGYRKISGDSCVGGVEDRYAPDQYACRVRNNGEFILYQEMSALKKFKLEDDSAEEVLVNQRTSGFIGAFDFDYNNNCVYLAFNELRKIQRLCIDGNHSVEDIHNSSISFVSALAYDWEGLNIYWIDSNFKSIEVSKRDGRYRRQLVRDGPLHRPRQLTLDPSHGWMYWFDTDQNGRPGIYRMWMDGTNGSVQTLLSGDQVGQLSSMTIDFDMERLYWSSGLGGIKSMEKNGSLVRTVLAGQSRNRPHAIGIYKEQLYWSDAFSTSLLSCSKYDCSSIMTVIQGVDIGQLRIFDETSHRGGNTACREEPGCSQLCLVKPPLAGDKHGRNRTCRCSENSTLSVIAMGGDERCCRFGISNTAGQCIIPSTSNTTSNATASNTTCNSYQFQCEDGKCISALWKCDRDNDCGDNSDEVDCKYGTCTSAQFTCGNGRCIPVTWKCDFDNDCHDNTDEQGCEDVYPTCSPDQFRCNNSHCITKSWVCDMDLDCPDGSDEADCHVNGTVCEFDEFECPTGTPHCILRSNVCDNSSQCADNADEKNCTSYEGCQSWHFRCDNGNCVYRSWLCDGRDDCGDNSDEAVAQCQNTTTTMRPTTTRRPTICGLHTFQCANHVCIPSTQECDGINDCGDNSDEIHCGTVRPYPCRYNEYQCRNGGCIPIWKKCNRVNDCPYNDDEHDCVHPTSGPQCGDDEFRCYNSSSRQCIWMASVCDFHRDCPNGEDEAHCGGGNTCDLTRYFKCHHSAGCLPRKLVCNDQFECEDYSDELGCQNHTTDMRTNTTCKDEHTFPCEFDNQCVPYMFVCDGRPNCKHASDENLPQCFDQWFGQKQLYEKRVTPTEITIGWDNYGSNFTYYLLSVFEHHGADTIYRNVTLKTNVYMMRNLHPARLYNFLVYVKKTDGTILKSYVVLQVTTKDGIPDSPSLVFCETDMKIKAINVTWYPPDVNKGKIINYRVYIKSGAYSPEYKDYSAKDGHQHIFIDTYKGKQLTIGTNYSVSVSAITEAGVGERANTTIIYGANSINAYVADLDAPNITDNTIRLTWSAPQKDKEKIDGYTVKYWDQFSSYVLANTTDTYFTATHLCPNTVYVFLVAPYSKKYGKGQTLSYGAKTLGEQIETPKNLTVKLIGPTTVNVSWILPKTVNYTDHPVTVYYDYKSEDMYTIKVTDDAQKVKVTPSTSYVVINKLRACEGYLFRVAVGRCKITNITIKQTSPDEEAEPEDLEATIVDKASLNLTWHSSCMQDFEPTGYILYRNEVATGVTKQSKKYVKTYETFLYQNLKQLTPGATYSLQVRNTFSPNSRISQPVNVTMPAYAAPISFQLGMAHTMQWQPSPDKIPKKLFNGYEVLMCSHGIDDVKVKDRKICTDNSEYAHYTTTMLEMANYTGLAAGQIFYFRVRLNKISGYYGKISSSTVAVRGDVYANDNGDNGNNSFGLKGTNLIAVIVSVSVVVIALFVILTFFIVRHKRLQRSFHAFASSHYDSRSGTTTFSAADDLDDEDTPMIRGFSDDEPLVIA